MLSFKVAHLTVVLTAVSVTLAVTGSNARAGAAGNGSDASLYVSDRFKQVAKRLVEQYVGSAIESACPADRPLCPAIVGRLAEAFKAATDGDQQALRMALSSFFVDSSIAGATSLFLDSATDVGASGLDPVGRKKVEIVMRPLTRCAVDVLLDRRTGGCKFGPEFKGAVTGLGLLDERYADFPSVQGLLGDLENHRAPKPKDVVRTLAAVAALPSIRQYDARVYLVLLEGAVSKGLEGGLYDFVQALLMEEVSMLDAMEVDRPERNRISLLEQKPDDATIRRTLAACDLSQAAFDDWVARRTEFHEARKYLRLGLPLPDRYLSAVRGLSRYQCSSADDGSRKFVADLARQAMYLHGPLQIHQLRTRYGIAMLAGAAVLDFVRSGDDAKLKIRLNDVVTQAVDAVAAHVCSTRFGVGICDEDLRQGVPICQVELVRWGLDPQGRKFPGVDKCRDLKRDADESVCRKISTADPPPGPKTGGTCHFPELKPFALDSESQKASKVQALVGVVDAVAKWVPQLQSEERQPLDASVRAMRFLAAGDPDAGRKAIARLAVEALVVRVREIAERQLDVKAASCEDSVHGTSIFSPLGASCAALVLIEAAYYPIADSLWDGGMRAENAEQLATSAYRSVLQSKLLAGSPILLNVGLGAAVVWGAEATWGSDPYVALTVVDKFGLIFGRRSCKNVTVEFGPFIGGFLDALVRTIADEEHRFWLAGGGLGFMRLGGSDFGFYLHAAAALPFEFGSGAGDRVGFATGAALTVPWDFYLTEEK